LKEPRRIDVAAPYVQLRALVWDPRDDPAGPITLCLHGFPDTAYGWRKVAPLLAEAGWRVVAPFMRGYVPSSVPSDGCYHVGALMDDALRVLSAVGPTGRDVIIGHDWGAIAGTGLAAMPDSPFQKAVIMYSKPPAQYAELHEHWLSAPKLPSLYLHGRDDGCATPDYVHWVERVLPDGSELAIVDHAGHFLQLEQPDVVARHIGDFVGQAA
jgi:pimeloyl-ACP methyl ester carboxylesterase